MNKANLDTDANLWKEYNILKHTSFMWGGASM